MNTRCDVCQQYFEPSDLFICCAGCFTPDPGKESAIIEAQAEELKTLRHVLFFAAEAAEQMAQVGILSTDQYHTFNSYATEAYAARKRLKELEGKGCADN